MRLMGIDYGGKRVGIALSDETGRFAYPYDVLLNDKRILDEINTICAKERVGKIVLGRSLDYNMRPNEIMVKIDEFKSELEIASGLSVDFEDEFMTTAEAERVQGKGSKTDASAAALILRSYIDKQNLTNSS